MHWYNKTTEEWCQANDVEEFMASGFYSVALFTQTHKFGCEYYACSLYSNEIESDRNTAIANLPLRPADHSLPGV